LFVLFVVLELFASPSFQFYASLKSFKKRGVAGLRVFDTFFDKKVKKQRIFTDLITQPKTSKTNSWGG
jgi:hypothetical protein